LENRGPFVSRFGLDRQGVTGAACVYWNLPAAQLYEHAVRRREALVAAHGPLVARTGDHTGRSPEDKFVVQAGEAAAHVWWGKANRPIEQERFDALRARLQAHWAGRDLYVFDGHAGAEPTYRMPVRVITEMAWHNLFARNMFLRETEGERLAAFEPRFTVFSAPSLEADPARDGTRTGTFILVDLEQHQVLIGGTQYAGEIKKSIFSVMNYYLPRQGVLSMHCSANYGKDRDDVALFFGLSGTGKTTLSADPERTLIGDDEHGWSEAGVFNIEGGCYAKVIRLSAEGEPEIWATTRRFGTILENVAIDPETRELDLDDDRWTENTRASYPIEQLSNVDLSGRAGHPRHIVFLTADAFGVLPPVARLTEPQALYHFLSGYTAKVAGTERGVTEPQATFSTCFGAPFMPLHPGVYAGMLGERMRGHGAKVWLVNTGWTGGPYGEGERLKLAHTRRMVAAALAGELDEVSTALDPVFGLAVPERVPGVPAGLLQPRATWRDPAAYDARAGELARMFVENFRQYEAGTSEAVRAAAPRR
jgi:phosphoenolpyruvate carboxykinase (ATP)